MLAEAEPTPEAGLRRLDQAARLRPPTRAYHLRRAACLDQGGRRGSGHAGTRAGGQLQPTTAFDHFLVGQERLQAAGLDRRRSGISTRRFDFERDHFWAQCLVGHCAGCKLKRPVQAKASLNACLEREPEFAWLYILRGFASSSPSAAIRSRLAGRPRARVRSNAASRLPTGRGSSSSGSRTTSCVTSSWSTAALLRLQRGDARPGGGGPAGGDPAQRPIVPGVCRAGGGLPEAGQAGRGRRAVRPGDRTRNRTAAPLYRGRADVDLARKDPTPAQRAQALGDLDQAIRLEKPDNPVLARTTPIGAGCWPSIIATPTPWRPGMPRSRSSPTTPRPTACGSICCSS